MESPKIKKAAGRVLALLAESGKTLAVAESCTGGLIGAALTEISGASEVFWGGYIVYSNEAKTALLGVHQDTLKQYGAVSKETAIEMARGALMRSGADYSVAVTGIAGPGGGSPEKPVGTVFIAADSRLKGVLVNKELFSGGRSDVRSQTAANALALLVECIEKDKA